MKNTLEDEEHRRKMPGKIDEQPRPVANIIGAFLKPKHYNAYLPDFLSRRLIQHKAESGNTFIVIFNRALLYYLDAYPKKNFRKQYDLLRPVATERDPNPVPYNPYLPLSLSYQLQLHKVLSDDTFIETFNIALLYYLDANKLNNRQ